jgi:hypothetical protein
MLVVSTAGDAGNVLEETSGTVMLWMPGAAEFRFLDLVHLASFTHSSCSGQEFGSGLGSLVSDTQDSDTQDSDTQRQRLALIVSEPAQMNKTKVYQDHGTSTDSDSDPEPGRNKSGLIGYVY